MLFNPPFVPVYILPFYLKQCYEIASEDAPHRIETFQEQTLSHLQTPVMPNVDVPGRHHHLWEGLVELLL